MDVGERLMGLFLTEIEERIDAFDRDLLALEAGGGVDPGELLSDLFRGAHSLKGAASSVGVPGIEAVCHAMEDLLAAARDGGTGLTPAQIQLLFDTADGLREAGKRLRAGMQPAPELTAYSRRLRDAAKGQGQAPPAAPKAPQASPAPRVPAPVPPAIVRDGSVRIEAQKLDRLLLESGELLVANNRTDVRQREIEELGETIRRIRAEWYRERGRAGRLHRDRLRELDRALDRFAGALAKDRVTLQQAARRLDAEVRRARMMPFAAACEGLDRIVRDTGRASGKQVTLQIEGGDIEIDRAILEGLRDPFIHLVRNAVDHGIETVERRLSTGKPPTGTISLKAGLLGNGIEIAVADDGAGLDLDGLRRRAQSKGIALDDDEIARAVFLPGVTTANRLTGLSGRGVGLDAVRTGIERLRGAIDVTSKAGEGTRFNLTLPLTLTTLRSVVFRLGERTYAIDSTIVERVARIHPEAVVSIEGKAYATGIGAPRPLVSLAAVLELPNAAERRAGEATPAILVHAGERRVALEVDELFDEREVMLRSLGPRLSGLRALAGVTVLADGSLVPIVSSSFIFERAILLARTSRSAAPKPVAAGPKRILLVDDSLTTRTLERSILEAEGYDVVTAGDGEEAWEVLCAHDVDLVISDVDMPRKDGFALAEAIRRSNEFRELPIVLVTARESDDDKRRGVAAGADAYIPKSGFDQAVLLETIGDLL